ncbi:fatty acyl-CoA reductase 1-like [Periplaneta americana]|uniref:fatty acyl-CoA reductase 1-like n=1 Tax=Periplaneta americana TaxID=6978 RepID=UPI0037E78343
MSVPNAVLKNGHNPKMNGTAKWVPPEPLPEREEGVDISKLPNRVADTLAGRVIFITGGTGFMGKVLLEKILRVCSDVDTIYLLIRSKKGKEPRQRVEELFSSPLFGKLKTQMDAATLARKVVGIPGDVSELNLGMSQEHRQLLIERVSIVYHAAATIRFDEPLKRAVLLNTRGTKQVLELAEQMKKLEAFLHISTSYCHLKERVLYEKLYPPPADPHKIIKCVEWLEEDVVNAMTKKILGDLPNTYAFTKALSEGLVAEKMDTLPVLILRPSIVIPVWRDPLPGWTDNINGPTGLLIGAGKGVIRTMYCNQEGYADYLPVDIAVNGILLATWNYIANENHGNRVYHLTSSSEFQITWAEIIDRGRRIVTEKVPLNGVVWYPGGSMKKSKLLHNICVFFFHLLPAILLDTLIFLSGNKPVLLRVQRRINKGFEVFEYYANNQWDFKNENVVQLRKIINERERRCFKIDGDELDLDIYITDCILAARQYILNEPLETLPAARRHMKIMYWVDVIAKLIFWGLLLWTLASWSENILDAIKGMFNMVGYIVSSGGSKMTLGH